MPPSELEERLVTVYADIHYYFGPPSIRPALHRFDKASYFYIYYNSTSGSSRIEIANNPGAPEQDAFHGHLDHCRIVNSHRFPTLMTLEVDGAPDVAPSSHIHDPDEWRLASGDPRKAGTSKYRLHTLDVYFWAEDDAKLVIKTLKQLLQPVQLDIAELEPEPHPDVEPAHTVRTEALSPLVQNLEHVAISDPAYQNGQTRNSQSVAHEAASIPAPPPAPQPGHSLSPPNAIPQSSSGPEQSQPFTPLAYNPAAPAAPEPIAHREDTPPPPEDGHGTGLAAAARHDHVPYQPAQAPQSYLHGAPPSQQQAYQVGQPPSRQQAYGPGQAASQPWTGVGPTAQAARQHYTSPFSAPPPLSSTTGTSIPAQGTSTHSYTPTDTNPTTAASPTSSQHRNSTAAQHYTPDPHAQMYAPSSQSQQPSVETPGAQFYSALPQPTSSPHRPLQHVQPQYPDYLSAATQQQQQQQQHGFFYGAASSQNMLGQPQNPYDIHSQVYRPDAGEVHGAHGGHGKRHSSSATGNTGPTIGGKQGKESRVEKGEKKVSGWMKKLESKVGL